MRTYRRMNIKKKEKKRIGTHFYFHSECSVLDQYFYSALTTSCRRLRTERTDVENVSCVTVNSLHTVDALHKRRIQFKPSMYLCITAHISTFYSSMHTRTRRTHLSMSVIRLYATPSEWNKNTKYMVVASVHHFSYYFFHPARGRRTLQSACV